MIDVGREYREIRDHSNERKKVSSRSARDIGPPPNRANPERYAAASESFRVFCEEYFPQAFTLKWSEDHLRAISKMERAAVHGGLFALAMPRGSGKTTLCERLALWSILTGRRPFVCLIGATEAAAVGLLESLKVELTYNELLQADFAPECHGFPELEGDARRASGQLCEGEKTGIVWKNERLVMPRNRATRCAGSIVTVCGLTGAIRGQKHTLPDGTILRPSLVIPDDPQTKESAMSPSQSARRAEILAGDVLGMAGPGKTIAAVMPCTVIAPGDMAETMLNREKHPLWQGERTKLVYSFPKNEELWEKYREIRNDSFRAEGDGSEATEFYKNHRDEMDEGVEVAWPERHNPEELSAIQHAMNLRFRNEHAFFAEYQNEPIPDDDGSEVKILTVEEIAAKVSGIERKVVPAECSHITAMIDISERLLHYVVCGWTADFRGYVIDYGVEPDQKRRFYSVRDCPTPLASEYKGGPDAVILAGLKALTNRLLTTDYEDEKGGPARQIGFLLFDNGYGPFTATGYQFAARSPHKARLKPSKGIATRASRGEFKRTDAIRRGPGWALAIPQARKDHLYEFDTNYWKTTVHSRLSTAEGDASSLSLFQAKSHDHELFAQHLTAEKPVRVTANGWTQDEWKLRPGRENHWFDCLIGCAVAASVLGCQLPGQVVEKPREKRRIKLSELQKARR